MTDLVSMVEQSVRRHADRPAICVASKHVSYQELWDLAGGVADLLASRLAGPGRVGLYAAKSVRTYAALLGVMRAGCAVVPLNTEWPSARRATIADQAGLATILVDGSQPVQAAEIDLRSVEPCARPREQALEADSISYIAFTSGSTGRPKGVPISHAHIATYICYVANRYEVRPEDRMSQMFNLAFDASMFDLFVSWTTGATVVVPTTRELLNPVRYLRANKITHSFTVPSSAFLSRRTRTLESGCLPGLRWSLFGGELLSYDLADAWFAAAPNITLENLYGPTEATVSCVAYRVPRDRTDRPVTSNGSVPIGTVYPGMEAIVLDEDLLPTANGELCLRGRQRFDGYLDPIDNIGRFVLADASARGDEPAVDNWYRTGDKVGVEHGLFVYLGRLDRQAKIRGYRIELEEVEAMLRHHPAIEDAAVIAADSQLYGFYVGESQPGTQMREFLRATLPSYMVPAELRPLDRFPLTSNGKVDRAALRALVGR